MSNLQLNVDVFGGANIGDAIHEISRLATKLGIVVGADMNGVHVMAKPFCDSRKLFELWQEALESKSPYKVVCGQPATLESLGTARAESEQKGDARP
jgi:hypothetical protein